MVAPQGNTFATKLKDPDVRQDAFRQYCEHLSKGFSQASFTFEHPTLSVTYKTMNRYIEENPQEFPPIQREISESKGQKYWEQVVMDSACGINKDANTASLQMLMRNKYSWDKNDVSEVADCAAEKVLDFIRKDLSCK